MKQNKILTSKQVQEIIEKYPHEKAADIANAYQVPVYKIYKTAQRYGVKKSPEFLHSPQSGRIQPGQNLSPHTQFTKGHKMASRRVKMSAQIKKKEKLEAWKANWFKKGQKPFNTAKDGEVRWRKNPGYYFIRIAENQWEFLHRHLWEKYNWPVPDGYNVIFLDGNRKNCKIENLACISNAQLADKNRHSKYPVELRKAIQLRNKLNKQIKQHEQAD